MGNNGTLHTISCNMIYLYLKSDIVHSYFATLNLFSIVDIMHRWIFFYFCYIFTLSYTFLSGYIESHLVFWLFVSVKPFSFKLESLAL